MPTYKLHLDLSGVPKIDYAGETIQKKFFKVLKLGYTKFLIDPDTNDLVDQDCLENNMPLVQCKTGLSSLTRKVFTGVFKIKEALSPDEAIVTATDIDGNEYRDYVLKKYNGTTILYEQSLDKAHQEIFVVEEGNIIKKMFSEISDLLINPVSSIAAITDSEAAGLVGNITTNIIDYVNNLFSPSTTESWADTVANVANNTAGNLTNYITNSTYNNSSTYDSPGNMDDESSNTTNPWLIIGGIAVASTIIGLGCSYFKKWQNSNSVGIPRNNDENAPLNNFENRDEEAQHVALNFARNHERLSIITEESELSGDCNYAEQA